MKDRSYIKGQRYTLLSRRKNLSLNGRRAREKTARGQPASEHRLPPQGNLRPVSWDYRTERGARAFFERWQDSLKWQRLHPGLWTVGRSRSLTKVWDSAKTTCNPVDDPVRPILTGLGPNPTSLLSTDFKDQASSLSAHSCLRPISVVAERSLRLTQHDFTAAALAAPCAPRLSSLVWRNSRQCVISATKRRCGSFQ